MRLGNLGTTFLAMIAVATAAISSATLTGCNRHTQGERASVEAQPATAAVVALDEHRSLGEPAHVDNLTVWPVFSDDTIDIGPILSLHGAEQQGVAQVLEVGAGGSAQVNRLVIENRSDHAILVPAGTVVKGGKQDRQIAEDMIIAANSTAPVGAFCVEQGRWVAQRDGVATNGQFASLNLVASKRVRASAQYNGDQQMVWDNVSMVNSYTGKSPATSTFIATIEETEGESVARRERLEQEVRQHFETSANEANGNDHELVGFAYAVNGEPLSVRAFANHALFQQQFPAFLTTMCIEADVMQRRDKARGKPGYTAIARADLIADMVQEINRASATHAAEDDNSRNVVRDCDRGGYSACLTKQSDGGNSTWIPVSEDWTAAVVYTPELEARLEELQALGYTK